MGLVGICRNPRACRNFHKYTQGCRNPTIIKQLNNVALCMLNGHLQVAFSSLLAKVKSATSLEGPPGRHLSPVSVA